MVGVILLLLALFLYIKGKRAYSILIYISFVSGIGGFSVLVDSVTGIKNEDLGFIYVVLINIYSAIMEPVKYRTFYKLDRVIKIFFAFMILSIFYSAIHYRMTGYELLQGTRQVFYFTSYYFIRKFKQDEVVKVIKYTFVITIITSVLYIVMSITGIPLLPDAERFESTDSISFMHRYYDSPEFLSFCIFFVMFGSNLFKIRNKQICFTILIIATVCTQGRTLMLIILISIILGFYFRRKLTTALKYLLPLGVVLAIFGGIISSRFEGDNSTSGDIQGVMQGDFVATAEGNAESGSTLTFRLAWCLERMIYLNNRPLSEKIFGLSLLSDQSPRVQGMYHFVIGNIDRETLKIAQLSTPDIAYGNMITKFGYGGSIIFLLIWINIFIIFYKQKDYSSLAFCGMIYVFYAICVSISSKGIFNTGNLTLPYLIIAYCQQQRALIQQSKIRTNGKS